MRNTARTFACVLLTAVIGRAQAPASQAFEAAVIRPASLPTPQSFQSGQFRIGSTIKGTSLDFEFVTLADLLPYAYRAKSFQIAGPDWMSQSRWNVVARLPEGSSQDQAPEMMQALLADRFKLSFHREKRQQPVYELTAIKGAVKLEAAEAGADAPASDSGAVAIGFGPAGFLPPGPPPGAGGPPPQDGARGGRGGAFNLGNGTRITQGANCAIRIEFDKLTMQSLADTLTPFLDKPVVDRTELKGAYKVAMDLPIETMMGMMQSQIRNSGFPAPGQGGERGFPGGPGGGRGGFGGQGGPLAGCIDPATAFGAGGTDASNTAIFQAVQKLGLKLQATKSPFDTIVVDRLEKTPTEN
jgi:uncharacterized protein (TIGR03435 family)